MREFQERRRIKKLLHSRYAIGALVIICLLFAHSLWGIYTKYQKSKGIMERVRADATALQSRQNGLQQSIDSLSTPEGKEREIRDRFGAVKDGEKMVVLVDDVASGNPSNIPAPQGWWAGFWSFFGF
jgi:uncharacterized protein YpmB